MTYDPNAPMPDVSDAFEAIAALLAEWDKEKRQDVLRSAEAAGWPELPLSPGVTVLAGEHAWRQFVSRDDGNKLTGARAAMEASARDP